MTSSLRTLVLGLTSAAIVTIMGGGLAIDLRHRVMAAKVRLADDSQRLAAGTMPLLIDALVVGDLATAEQILRRVNADGTWRRVQILDPNAPRVMLDASPRTERPSRAPRWFRRLLPIALPEPRHVIEVDPVVYGVLVVEPSAVGVESDLWGQAREMLVIAVVLLATLLVVIGGILTWGFRPIRTLAERAARLGRGDLSTRVPETRLAEIAPTVAAFNSMAASLEQLLADLRAKEMANRRLAAIAEQSEEAIFTVGLDERITSWNRGAERLFGWSADAALGRALGTLFGPDEQTGQRQVATLLATRPPARFETIARPSEAPPVPAAAAASPLDGDAGAQIGHIVVVRDITARKRVERELQEAKERAEGGSRAKSEFLATMSHEIRTPMNGILGMSELLAATPLTAEQRESLDVIRSSGEALLQVINDILDISRIEAGHVDVEALEFDLHAVVADSLKPLGRQAHLKGLSLTAAVAPDVPHRVVGDAGRLRQVLVNLVGNAVKFTERGEIAVAVDAVGGGERDVEIHTCVRDTGIGIPADKLSVIFQAFTQVDSSMSRRYGGTGLGLAITSRLVGLMGGRAWAESELGRGSTFHFTVRLGLASAGTVPRPTPLGASNGCPGTVPRRALRVLLAEDNAVNRLVARRMLEKLGHRVVLAESGRAALAAVETEAFDLVFMDVEMPDINGLDATRAIRAIEADIRAGRRAPNPHSTYTAAGRAGRRIPIIALTAHAMEVHQEQCRAAGMDDYISKPMHAAALAAAVDRMI